MDDRVRAEGLATGLNKSLNAAMWDGLQWRRAGTLIGRHLTEAIKDVPHTCAYCRTQINATIAITLTSQLEAADVEHLVQEVEGG